MSISNLIVHEIQKHEGERKAILIARPNENPVDGQAEALSAQVTNLFNRSGMNTGRFVNPQGSEEGAQLPALLFKNFKNDTFVDFAGFTKDCAAEFLKYLEPVEEAEGGLLWFNHYELHDTHFLYIVMLKRKKGIGLGADLSLSQIEQIEMEKLHMSLRINLTAWQAGDEGRYISFRFGRAPKFESEYFTQFIGCDEPKVAAKETRKLVDLTAAFCQSEGFPSKQANEFKKVVSEHCQAKAQDREPLAIKEIASQVESRFSIEQANKFLEIADSDSFKMEKEIFVEKAALKKLTRLSGSSRALTISFDSELLAESIVFNADSGTLTIKDLPKSLLKQLQAMSN
ncbi:nucleoid-associated protein [Marinomonas polaris DSM 16579]|uniref:Nucleoid-associated protein n=1 Tax=Marinomonas polaris DSM 16579 TaxID=1122206 RepID=A0A1M5CL67_9GAMM|nr:nucleoid-associated protein [Marinomonas polaris]SHF55172.1 nucleoid-associated protein [Marinomonas polaris DSM 16579]